MFLIFCTVFDWGRLYKRIKVTRHMTLWVLQIVGQSVAPQLLRHCGNAWSVDGRIFRRNKSKSGWCYWRVGAIGGLVLLVFAGL